MITTTNLAKLIKEGNEWPVIEEVDLEDVKLIIDDLSFENCMICLCGKNILDKETELSIQVNEKLGKPKTETKKEEWTKV